MDWHVERFLNNSRHTNLLATNNTTTFFFILLLVFWILNICTDADNRNEHARSTWYHKLPDENLHGVPQRILDNEKRYPFFKTVWLSIIGSSGNSKFIIKEARKRQRVQKLIDESVKFPCDLRNAQSKKKPISVHAVKPGDIDIVAAMGDSLTAGNGAFALDEPHLTVENRGVSAAIGGQGNWRQFLTLPNILKEFNPKLIGYSLKDSFTHQPESQFNIAEIGTMSQDLPYMSRQLVKRIKSDRRVDFNNDWKLVTVLIGSNNFCSDICFLKDAKTSINDHKDHLITSFQFLRDNMPRTIVNFILTPNLKLLINLKGVPPKCEFIHLYECPCLFTIQHKHRRKEFIRIMNEWQRVEEEVINDERLKIKEDFTVILQPFTKNLSLPLIRDTITGRVTSDFTYLSEDCFHFSQKGYSRAANALWNNMLEPISSKSNTWQTEFQKILCPTERSPYIFTWKNSES
ncbi:hypothetical protein PGB90_006537 [Kerria lacca]